MVLGFFGLMARLVVGGGVGSAVDGVIAIISGAITPHVIDQCINHQGDGDGEGGVMQDRGKLPAEYGGHCDESKSIQSS